MPIYEFHCKDCDRDAEILLRTSDWKGTTCPHCGSTNLEKALSVFATSSETSTSADLPPCSGQPASCGRCGMN